MRKLSVLFLCVFLAAFAAGCKGSEAIPIGEPTIAYDSRTTADGVLLQGKRFDYHNGNVVIMQAVNQTDAVLDLVIHMEYQNEEGRTTLKEEREFSGFGAGCENYFVFRPNMVFTGYSFTLTTKPHEGEAYPPYLQFCIPDANGKVGDFVMEPYPTESTPLLSLGGVYSCKNTYSKPLGFAADFVLFDGRGEIHFLDTKLEFTTVNAESDSWYRPFEITDCLWENRRDYNLPEELQGAVTGLVAVKRVDVENWVKTPSELS